MCVCAPACASAGVSPRCSFLMAIMAAHVLGSCALAGSNPMVRCICLIYFPCRSAMPSVISPRDIYIDKQTGCWSAVNNNGFWHLDIHFNGESDVMPEGLFSCPRDKTDMCISTIQQHMETFWEWSRVSGVKPLLPSSQQQWCCDGESKWVQLR
jgi:hypothetical protein